MNFYKNQIIVAVLVMTTETLAQVHENTVTGPNGGSITVTSVTPEEPSTRNKFEVIAQNTGPEPLMKCDDEPDMGTEDSKDEDACKAAKNKWVEVTKDA
jgi:hypothetical protein